jgi:hypothetical protein
VTSYQATSQVDGCKQVSPVAMTIEDGKFFFKDEVESSESLAE